MRAFDDISSAAWKAIGILIPVWPSALDAVARTSSPNDRDETLRQLVVGYALRPNLDAAVALASAELSPEDWDDVVEALELIASAMASDASAAESQQGR